MSNGAITLVNLALEDGVGLRHLLKLNTKERIIQVQSFSIQSLYPRTKLTRQNERHLIIKLCICMTTLKHKLLSPEITTHGGLG